MQEYFPLFALAFIWTLFAAIQDLKSREVANWLTFSFIAFALAYRALYSAAVHNVSFFLYGLAGFAIFFVLGHAFYYAKVFAGGDAKLLMGFGIILPYENLSNLIVLPIFLIFVLFFAGSVYSILYSLFLVAKNKERFKAEFKKRSEKIKSLLILSALVCIISLILGFSSPYFFLLSIISATPLIFIYTKSLDKCMIVLTSPEKLTEGDWLEQEVKMGKVTIRKSVHGLSFKDIKLLQKAKKSVLIKQGIPFVPAFLITLIIMVFFFAASQRFPLPFSLLF